jgi:NADH dehydrogenase
MKVVLIGACGFLGRYLLSALAAENHECRVLTRALIRHGNLGLMPGVKLVQADVYDVDVLTRQFAGADVVVSMAGILNESGRGGRGFQKVHVELVEGIVEACRVAGVKRVLHVSALNAGKGSSHYLKSKGRAEELLQHVEDLDVSIFQPSVIFGRGDSFFNRFAAMLHLTPVLPLACPAARIQPVFAGDVANAMLATLDDPMTCGKSYELAGPQIYSLKEMLVWTAKNMGKRRLIVGLPGPLSALMAALMEWVPGKPFSWDNYQSLKTDNTSEQKGFTCFGIYPRGIDTVVPDYLTGSTRQRRLQSFRRRPRI